MKTIETKYHGPTNSRGSRISAIVCGHNKIFVPYNYALNSEENHMKAAKTLCQKLGWEGELHGGHTKNGMVFIFS